MPIPTSGPISLGMFNTEFSLGNSFSAYRGKGSVPASGPISFSQLYGASNVIRQPASGEYFNNIGSPTTANPFYYWTPANMFGGSALSVNIFWNYQATGSANGAATSNLPGAGYWVGQSPTDNHWTYWDRGNNGLTLTTTSIVLGGITYYRGALKSGTLNAENAMYAVYRILP